LRISQDEYRRLKAEQSTLKQSKYRNIKTKVNGITFDSQAEARRYQELKLLEKAGEIKNLKLQPKFILVPKTKKRRAVSYSADFQYEEMVHDIDKLDLNINAYFGSDGKQYYIKVVEDVKSPATAKNKAYIVKRNLFEYQNPYIDFREIM